MLYVNTFTPCGLWFFTAYYTLINIYIQSYTIVTQFFQNHKEPNPQPVLAPLKIHKDASV